MSRSAAAPVGQDWDFADHGMKQTQASVHFFHHWTAKFIPQIPRRIIEQYAAPRRRRARSLHGVRYHAGRGRRASATTAWGTDINPLAWRIARAKTGAHR